MASLMLAGNETGALQPLEVRRRLIEEHEQRIHLLHGS